MPQPASANCSTSVVIPVGRADEAFEAQLDAVRAQRGVKLVEIILAVNDAARGAMDRVRLLVGRRDDRRVRVIDASGRRGASFARNCGAAVATGDVLAFCDADDLVSAGWLAALVAGLVLFDVVGGRLDEIAGVSTHHRPPPTPGALPTFLGVPYIVSANMAIPRATFESAGGFDTELHRCEDIALSWQLLVSGSTLGYVDDACVGYRPRSGAVAIARQHFAYGRGMAQVLARYGIPDDGRWRPVHGRGLLQPNGQAGGSGGLFALTRRLALASGRVLGALTECVGRDRPHRRNLAA